MGGGEVEWRWEEGGGGVGCGLGATSTEGGVCEELEAAGGVLWDHLIT